MQKKILCLLTAMVLFVVLSLSMVGCNTCKHVIKNLVKNTATCTTNGIATYQCNGCGKTLEEESMALGHDYHIVSNTATCTTEGIQTSQCSRCQDIRTENVNAKGHNYSINGNCYSCHEFKYNISLSVDLPKEFTYKNKTTNHTYSRFLLTKLSFQIEYNTVYINFEGTKTYDEDGIYGNERIYCTVVLKERDTGKIIGSDSLYATNLIVNQTFQNDNHKICKVSDLDTEKTYILEIVDTII